jgi:hypothetical protein
MVEILQKTEDIHLIEKYSPIVLTKNPKKGITIFTKRRKLLDEVKVIKFLSTVKNIDVAIQEYLEYLILHGNENPKNHTLLGKIAFSLITKLRITLIRFQNKIKMHLEQREVQMELLDQNCSFIFLKVHFVNMKRFLID